ncbi:MAG: ComEC/Rec2 family competence protein [Alphaproteobacteria bacterium]|nr:ComEC/Rec2 family competence protein [Alphaproteobacteria bacterium]
MSQAGRAPVFAAVGPAETGGFSAWAALQRGRVALWSPVMLGLGALAYFELTFEPSHLWGLAALLAAVLCAVLSSYLPWRWLPMAVGLVALGFAATILRAELMDAPVLAERTPVILMKGQVVDAYGHQDGRPRVTLALTEAGRLDATHRPAIVRIALRKTDERPLPGSWIELTGRLTTLPTPVAPGAYDFARAAYFDGIGAYGFAMGSPREIQPAGDTTLVERFAIWVASARHDASARIRAVLPGSAGAIAAALTVGDRSEISESDQEALRDSSLAHVLSISGLHMAIVGLGVFNVLRFLAALMPPIALRYQVKKWAAAIALVAAGGYLMLSGASVPAQRSFIMIGLMFVAVMVDRAPFTLRVVAISALAVLLIAPESVVDPSFQMSFAAVAALVSAFEAFDAWQTRRGQPLVLRDTWTGRLIYALIVALLASVVAGLATAPYAAFHFNRVAAYGVVANVLAMPVISFVIMPAAAFTLLAMPFGLEYWPVKVMGWGIDVMLWVAHRTSSWPGASSLVPSPPTWGLGLVTIGGLWLLIWRGPWRLAGLAPIAAGLLAVTIVRGPDILIDRDVGNVAVRVGGQLALVSGRRGRFAAEEWLERDGDASEVKDSARRGRNGAWQCAGKVCTAGVGGVRIVYAAKGTSAAQACADPPDILVTAMDGLDCGRQLTVGPAQTQVQGAYAIWAGDGALITETVRGDIGERPWTVWAAQ